MTPAYRDVEVGAELTDRESEVLGLRDGGMSAADVATQLGLASANVVNNIYNVARTKKGRASEIRRGGGGGKRVEIENSTLRSIRDVIDRMRSVIDSEGAKLHEARESVEAKPSEIVNAEHDRLVAAVESAQARLTAHENMSKSDRDSFVESHREAARKRLSELETAHAEQVEKARAELETATQAFLNLGGTEEMLAPASESDDS